MEEETLQNNKLSILGKLTAGIFHEIRNPLSVIKLNLDYLKLINDEIPDEANCSVSSAYEALERMEQLINSIIVFSRKEKRDGDYSSIPDIISKTLDILSSRARKDGVIISNKISPDIPKVLFNKNKLMQVILNLVINSLEASRQGGKIELSNSVNSENELVIKISDDGCGISEEVKPLIFNDFYTNKHEGTGIGLTICKEILKENNCSLHFESESGIGTTFFITINKNLIADNDKEITDN